MELHREEADHYPVAIDVSSIVGPPPHQGRLEDNSFLYETPHAGLHHAATRGRNMDADWEGRRTASYHTATSTRPTTQHTTGPPKQLITSPLRGLSSAAALEQIEILNIDKRQLKQTIVTLHQQLEHFHNITGPNLDAFHAEQVQLREDVMRLREELRASQQREHDVRSRVKELEIALMRTQQTSQVPDNDPESRLAKLQDAISKAYLQRSAIIREREAAIELKKSVEWRNEALELLPDKTGGARVADVGGSLSHWRARGKEAELDALLQQKETLIASLSAAAKEVEALLDDPQSRKNHYQLGQVNAKCPGCSNSQWSSPYCPKTGHLHAGFRQDSTPQKATASIAPIRRESVDDLLQKGLWRKVVDVETAAISYEEVASGRVVPDLGLELDRQHRTAISAAKAEEERRQVPSLPKDATIVSSRGPAPPGIDKEMRLLLSTVEERNQEISRLKELLQRLLDHGGLAALPGVQYPDAAPNPGAFPPLRELPNAATLPLEDQLALLRETNEQLNQRCAEMAVEAQAREQRIGLLEKEVTRLRFGGS